MYNYEHETKEIKDRYLRNFIFYDYFHDSVITEIKILNEGKLIQIELSCEREWPSHDWEKYVTDKNYTYKLCFINCYYFEYQRDNFGTYAEYLNGRFKNSARLAEINKKSKRHNYHLRIQLADGYLDFIFSKFQMEKYNANISLPKRVSLNWHFDFIKNKFRDMNIDEVHTIAVSGDYLLRSYAIEYLWYIGDDSILEIACNSLSDEDACIPAIFVIGNNGGLEHIESLNNLLKQEDSSYIFSRHIRDAIEKIVSRC